MDEFGYALRVVQRGGVPPQAKAWKGAGSGILELREDDRGNTYRVVYAVRFERAVYVIHCFQKKSHVGIRTAMRDVELILTRIKSAEKDHLERYAP